MYHSFRYALVGAALGTLSTTSFADGVSLYGELDSGLAYVDNVAGRSQLQTTSGLIDGSFWGLQGSEDLGAGAKALFRLEHGYSVTSGEDLNDHPAYVGLQSDTFGTVTLGHQYDLVHDYFAPFTLTGGTGGTAFAHPLDNDNANNSWLAANALKYASASYGGFTFGGMYAFSNGAGGFAGNRAYGFGLNYGHGPFNAGAAWMLNDGRGSTRSGAYDPLQLPGSGGALINASVRKQDVIGAGASYALGDVTVAGAWSRAIHTGVMDVDSAQASPSVAFSNYEVSAVWQMTSAVSLAGMYVYTHASPAHWHQGAVQSVYALSKRTDVYAEAIYQRASAGGVAMVYGIDRSAGRAQLVVTSGIRHRF